MAHNEARCRLLVTSEHVQLSVLCNSQLRPSSQRKINCQVSINLRSAQRRIRDFDDDVCGCFNLGDGPILHRDLKRAIEDDGFHSSLGHFDISFVVSARMLCSD